MWLYERHEMVRTQSGMGLPRPVRKIEMLHEHEGFC